MIRAILLLASAAILASAQPSTPGCIFGELGVDVGTHTSLDSIESQRRVTLAEYTFVENNDAYVYAGDLFMDWHAAVDQCVWVANPFKDVWWEGGERFRPSICQAPAVTSRVARICTVFGDPNNNHTIDFPHKNTTNTTAPPVFTLDNPSVVNGYVEVKEGEILEVEIPGIYNFQNLHMHDGSIVWYSGPPGGEVQFRAVESIVLEHNVAFVNFGEGEDGILTLLYANDAAVSPLLSRGIEIWSASRDETQPLRVENIISQGDIFIGWRRSIKGCLEAARYVDIQNNLKIERLGTPGEPVAACA